MAKFKFVGFQEHVEVPEGFELLEIKEEIQCTLHRDDVFSLLSEPAKLSLWFYQVLSLESKSSGKITFLSSDGVKSEGICLAYDSGKEISFLADRFGEFAAKIKGSKNSVLSVKFRILTNDPKSMSEELLVLMSNLRKLVAK